MSPKSRTRKPKSAGKERRNAPPPNPIAELYRRVAPHFAADLDQTSSLESEQMASAVYAGMHQTTNLGAGIDNTLFSDWVGHAERQANRTSAAVLWAMAQVADAPGDAQAAAAAGRLAEAGVEPPAWLAPLRKLEATAAWMLTDVFGDFIEIVIEFRAGRRKHGLYLSIDTNHLGGYATEVVFSDSARDLLKTLERSALRMAGAAVVPVGLPEARRLGLDAIAATDITSNPEVGPNYDRDRALALKRLLALPESSVVDVNARRAQSEAEEQAQIRADEAESERLVATFMRAIQKDIAPASARAFKEQFIRLADLAIGFGRDYDGGRLVRVSPPKMDTFVGWFLPRKVMLDDVELEALPWFLNAWVDWCAAQMGLPEAAVDLLVDAVGEALDDAEELRNSDEDERSPGMAFLEGLDLANLEEAQAAMDRRQLAMPYFGTWIGSDDYPQLNANKPEELRLLVLGELEELHTVGMDEYPSSAAPDGSPVWSAALRELVVSQLWNDEPPQVWQAAQRLRTQGLGREEILDQLQAVLAGHVDATKVQPGSGFGSAVHIKGYMAALAAVGAAGRKGGHLRSV
ncbi:hypothetical protein [Arthrobacter sp. TB 23]|uniref:hypothetical protein n=1 Tax=Arthrobacter sp. TB 23 TaxID=494419 RepID=UPI0012E9F05C|nr:hypothetical protein [Arthrobacter sp. TB 23]